MLWKESKKIQVRVWRHMWYVIWPVRIQLILRVRLHRSTTYEGALKIIKAVLSQVS